MRLKWISKKFVVLYDVHERRAWFVDGASALLHLVRASLRHDGSDPFKDLFLFEEASLQEPRARFTGKFAAIHILTNKANVSLPLYAKPTDCKVEETKSDNGARKTVWSTTSRDYTFKDRVDDIYERLEQIMAHQADVASQDGVGFRIRHTLRRQLEGFDFMDVATDEDPLWPRVTTVRASGRGWIDLTRALHAITLFGTGFGELLRPAKKSGGCGGCLVNSEVPKGEDYLAVCTLELQEILEKRGTKSTSPWRLVDDIYWHTPDKSFEPCQCKKLSLRKHDRVQVLLPSSLPGFWGRGFSSPARLPTQGAVLFGHSWRFPLRWKDHGLPEEGEPDDGLEEMEACFHDSGLGTSLESSSAAAEGSSRSDSHVEPDETRLNIPRNAEILGRPLKRQGPTLNRLDSVSSGDLATQGMRSGPSKRHKGAAGDAEETQEASSESVLASEPSELISAPRSRTAYPVILETTARFPFDPEERRSHSPTLLDSWKYNVRKWKGKDKAT